MISSDATADPRSIRLFIDAATLSEGGEVVLGERHARYLGAVMRRAPGDGLRVFNGRDGEWSARIEAIDKRSVRLRVVALLRAQAPEPDLWLLLSIIKRDAFELAVEKATELGAAAILPVITARSQPGRANPERLRAIALEAAEQCERLTVPDIHAPLPLAEVLAGWQSERVLVAAIERSDAPAPPRPAGPAALLVGPEGGFDQRELDALRRLPFLLPASLGPRILRAETAAIVGLALLQAADRA
jgi:16S rRNA (uracil1498-N3)-methyltransferase